MHPLLQHDHLAGELQVQPVYGAVRGRVRADQRRRDRNQSLRVQGQQGEPRERRDRVQVAHDDHGLRLPVLQGPGHLRLGRVRLARHGLRLHRAQQREPGHHARRRGLRALCLQVHALRQHGLGRLVRCVHQPQNSAQ